MPHDTIEQKIMVGLIVAVVAIAVSFNKRSLRETLSTKNLPHRRYPVSWGIKTGFAFVFFFAFVAPIFFSSALNAIKPHLSSEFKKSFLIDKTDSLFALINGDQNIESDEQEETNALQESQQDPTDPPSENALNTAASTSSQETAQNSDASDDIRSESSASQTAKESSTSVLDVDRTAEASTNVNKPKSDLSKKISRQHPFARLIIVTKHSKYYLLPLVLFAVCVIFLSPLVEEFVFRVVLQGALESETDPQRPLTSQTHDRSLILKIGIPAVVFTLLHIGSTGNENSELRVAPLLIALVAQFLTDVAILVGGLLFLLKTKAPSPIELGLPTLSLRALFSKSVLKKITQDIIDGLYLFLSISPFVYAVDIIFQEFGLFTLAGPITLFLFAIFQGYVYHKTKSWALVFSSHMTLNFISFMLTLLWCSTL